MKRKLFTLDEVEQLVPRLQQCFQKLLYHKKEMAQCSNRLRYYGAVPQLVGRVPTEAAPEVQQLQAEVRRHYREFKNKLFDVESLGGEIKNLELGRVDFNCLHEGMKRVLTWQLGVTEGVYLQPIEDDFDPPLMRTVQMKMPAVDYPY